MASTLWWPSLECQIGKETELQDVVLTTRSTTTVLFADTKRNLVLQLVVFTIEVFTTILFERDERKDFKKEGKKCLGNLINTLVGF